MILTALTEELGPKHLLEKIDGLIALLIDALNIQAVQASVCILFILIIKFRSSKLETFEIKLAFICVVLLDRYYLIYLPCHAQKPPIH